MKFRTVLSTSLALALTLAAHTHAGGPSAGSAASSSISGFTYQGVLKQAGVPFTGNVEVSYALFDAATVGNLVATTSPATQVVVATDGLFTVQLDFGGAAFSTYAQRWMEVSVRVPPGVGSFTTLVPRQQITPTPTAIRAATASGIDLPYSTTVDVASTGFEVRNTSLEFASVGILGSGYTGVLGRCDIEGGSAVVGLTADGESQVFGGLAAGGAGVIGYNPQRGGSTGYLAYPGYGLYATTIEGIGVYGSTGDCEGAGVLGQGFGVYGELGACRKAVYGWGDMADGYGGYFVGRGYFSGLVGLGVEQPQFRLDLPNTAENGGQGRANAWTTYSSIRWKENVRPIEDALNKVLKLRGVTFDWKPEHGGNHDIGFVAEEVGAVVPELVVWESDHHYAQSMKYDRVTALAVEAIKAQQQRIELLESENASLRARLEAIERLVHRIPIGTEGSDVVHIKETSQD